MIWSECTLGWTWKRLVRVELPGYRSSQHEFNIPKKSIQFFEEETSGSHASFHFFFAGDQIAKRHYVPVFAYDARRNTPGRIEWRLYYSTEIDDDMSSMEPGDLLLFYRDLDHLLNIVVCSRQSIWQNEFKALVRESEAVLFDTALPSGLVGHLELTDKYRIRSTNQLIRAAEETLGSKVKDWYQPTERSQVRLLYKKARPNTGEHWVEKISVELASLIGLPVARLDLAVDESETPGVLSSSFLSHVDLTKKVLGPRPSDFVEANRLLHEFDASYDPDRKRKQNNYTLNNILFALKGKMGSDALAAFQQLLQYLVFDCWIGNTDRHHENWGLQIYTSRSQLTPYYGLSPTYDHGAALAATRTPDAKKKIMENGIEKFYARGQSAIYDPRLSETKALSFKQLLQACFQYESEIYGSPKASLAIADRICWTSLDAIRRIFSRIPPGLGLTEIDREFTLSYLAHSRNVIENYKNSVLGVATDAP